MKIKQEILEILQNCRIEGNTLYLPETQLDRTTYTNVNKCLESIGGKWNRKAKGHVFDDDHTEAFENMLLTGETADTKKLFQFFPTPREVAEQMCEMAELDENSVVLEPSVGKGDLADVVYEQGVEFLFGIELNADMQKHLKDKPYTTTTGLDFLDYAKDVKKGAARSDYTHVIMNPPFTKQQDIDHIRAAFDCLAPGGILVSVAGTSWQWRQDKKSTAFREWLYEMESRLGVDYVEIVELGKGAFKESGTMIPTVIIKIRREGAGELRKENSQFSALSSQLSTAEPKPKGEFNMIQNIEVRRIIPHPQNPRQDLGDLTELADSMKALQEQGQPPILQNLTVVPHVNQTMSPGMHGSKETERYHGYMVIIGHRRLEAAKLAGLETVPCAVVEMDDAAQISTMLLENMQRADLTVYEQAQGMQMMLDLGETAATIAAKTGFSQTTVRSRVKLLALDKDKFEAANGRGATLADFMELDKIQDVQLKNEVAEHLGTNNFAWNLRNAIQVESSRAKRKAILETLDTFAIKADTTEGYLAKRIPTWSDKPFETPDDAGRTRYFYYVEPSESDTGSIYLMTENIPDPAASEKERKKQEERVRRQEAMEQLKEIHDRAYELRRDFMSGYTYKKEHLPAISRMALYSILTNQYAHSNFKKFEELIYGEREENENEDGGPPTVDDLIAKGNYGNLVMAFLAQAAYINGMDSSGWTYCERHNIRKNGEYKSNAELDRCYEYLCALGYEMSDEEKALQDGTHELFVRDEPDA